MEHNAAGFQVGDVVQHIRDASWIGVIVEIDTDYFDRDVTTCTVAWDVTSLNDAERILRSELDVQWTNKLCRYDGD